MTIANFSCTTYSTCHVMYCCYASDVLLLLQLLPVTSHDLICRTHQAEMDWEACEWSCDGETTPELTWEPCEWSEPEGQYQPNDPARNPLQIWDHSSESSEPPIAEDNLGDTTSWSSTPPCGFSCSAAPSPIRMSPRVPKPKVKFDPSNAVHTEEGWQLTQVMNLTGCNAKCATAIHDLTDYDVLQAHATFSGKTVTQQWCWLLDYFETHCPNTSSGEKDVKNMHYQLSGRSVCQALWQAVLGISMSRFYAARKDFMAGNSRASCEQKKSRSMTRKSMEAIAWMSSYFDRIGDKRPDKDGIYLPTSLTEKAIFDIMLEDMGGDSSSTVCFSQFNRIYRQHFPHVTIPKVCYEIATT